MNKAEWIRGKTVEQIVNMPLKELEKLTESQLRTVVGRLVSAGNKRMRRMEESARKNGNISSNAQYLFIQQGQRGTYQQLKFSTIGKNKESLLQEFKRASSFMKSEKTSLKGIKNIHKKSIEGLRKMGIKIGKLSKANYDRFWRAYEEFKHLHPDIDEKNFKYTIIENMSFAIEDKKTVDIEKLIGAIEDDIDEIYEEQEKLKQGDGTSGFFNVEY